MVKHGERREGRWRVAVWGTAGFILILPLVAMLFSEEMNWGPGDFLIVGAMLAIACSTYELAAKVRVNSAYRLGLGVAVVASFLLVWVNLALGIIGSEDNSLNLMYGGVLAVALAGAVVGGFRPAGMARAFAAAAAAQLLVSVIALTAGYFTLVLDGFFAAMWLISAGLFRKSAREQRSAGQAPTA